jgi:hypothetical protein
MTFSTAWVPSASLILKRYVGQASIGLASWAGSVGCSQVSLSPLFSVMFFFSFSIFQI